MTEPHVTIYTSDSSRTTSAKMIRAMFTDLLASRELAWRLAVRDIRAQYLQAFFGILWAFILPLANTLAWVFLNSSGIVSVGETTLPYPFYVFTGTMFWAIFMDALNAPLQQVNAARSMLGKLNFPREALVVSGVYQTIFNALIKVGLLFIVMFFVGVKPGVSLIYFPLGLASLVLVGTVLGLMITPIGVLYTDVGRGLPLLMQFLMYITPVVFPMPEAGMARLLFSFNPLTPVVSTVRDWFSGQPPEFLLPFILVNLFAVVLLLLCWGIYRLAMPILIERMSA
ncbi:MAG: polysialic acid transporter [Desulfuromonas sp.]|nr:MAG: polysialic acid transporter [Desulfuromonas sp.]